MHLRRYSPLLYLCINSRTRRVTYYVSKLKVNHATSYYCCSGYARRGSECPVGMSDLISTWYRIPERAMYLAKNDFVLWWQMESRRQWVEFKDLLDLKKRASIRLQKTGIHTSFRWATAFIERVINSCILIFASSESLFFSKVWFIL